MHPFRPVTLTLALAAVCAAPAHAQSLLELVQSASEIDSTWQASRAQLEAAEGRSGQARAGLLPSAGLAAGWSIADTEVTRPPVNANTVTQNIAISASQPLYRPANGITYEQSKRGIDLARIQLEGTTQDLLVRVSQAYFDVLAAEDTLASVRAQKSAVGEQLAAAKRNFEVGTSTITDSREAQARFDLVRAQEIAAENDLRVKRLALDQLTGGANVEPLPLDKPVRLPQPTPEDVIAWVQTAQSEQSQVRAAAIALDVARLETRKAETGHLPTQPAGQSSTLHRCRQRLGGRMASPKDRSGHPFGKINGSFSRQDPRLLSICVPHRARVLSGMGNRFDHRPRVSRDRLAAGGHRSRPCAGSRSAWQMENRLADHVLHHRDGLAHV